MSRVAPLRGLKRSSVHKHSRGSILFVIGVKQSILSGTHSHPCQEIYIVGENPSASTRSGHLCFMNIWINVFWDRLLCPYDATLWHGSYLGRMWIYVCIRYQRYTSCYFEGRASHPSLIPLLLSIYILFLIKKGTHHVSGAWSWACTTMYNVIKGNRFGRLGHQVRRGRKKSPLEDLGKAA